MQFDNIQYPEFPKECCECGKDMDENQQKWVWSHYQVIKKRCTHCKEMKEKQWADIQCGSKIDYLKKF